MKKIIPIISALSFVTPAMAYTKGYNSILNIVPENHIVICDTEENVSPISFSVKEGNITILKSYMGHDNIIMDEVKKEETNDSFRAYYNGGDFPYEIWFFPNDPMEFPSPMIAEYNRSKKDGYYVKGYDCRIMPMD